ncbi:hypothetical protein C8Q77DRAFT_758725 [Trametes polyzona]|nr:hypothetical protein C8Q77DRAFT_758725 [Trametes polyzona]
MRGRRVAPRDIVRCMRLEERGQHTSLLSESVKVRTSPTATTLCQPPAVPGLPPAACGRLGRRARLCDCAGRTPLDPPSAFTRRRTFLRASYGREHYRDCGKSIHPTLVCGYNEVRGRKWHVRAARTLDARRERKRRGLGQGRVRVRVRCCTGARHASVSARWAMCTVESRLVHTLTASAYRCGEYQHLTATTAPSRDLVLDGGRAGEQCARPAVS